MDQNTVRDVAYAVLLGFVTTLNEYNIQSNSNHSKLEAGKNSLRPERMHACENVNCRRAQEQPERRVGCGSHAAVRPEQTAGSVLDMQLLPAYL